MNEETDVTQDASDELVNFIGRKLRLTKPKPTSAEKRKANRQQAKAQRKVNRERGKRGQKQSGRF